MVGSQVSQYQIKCRGKVIFDLSKKPEAREVHGELENTMFGDSKIHLGGGVRKSLLTYERVSGTLLARLD